MGNRTCGPQIGTVLTQNYPDAVLDTTSSLYGTRPKGRGTDDPLLPKRPIPKSLSTNPTAGDYGTYALGDTMNLKPTRSVERLLYGDRFPTGPATTGQNIKDFLNELKTILERKHGVLRDPVVSLPASFGSVTYDRPSTVTSWTFDPNHLRYSIYIILEQFVPEGDRGAQYPEEKRMTPEMLRRTFMMRTSTLKNFVHDGPDQGHVKNVDGLVQYMCCVPAAARILTVMSQHPCTYTELIGYFNSVREALHTLGPPRADIQIEVGQKFIAVLDDTGGTVHEAEIGAPGIPDKTGRVVDWSDLAKELQLYQSFKLTFKVSVDRNTCTMSPELLEAAHRIYDAVEHNY